MRKTYWPILALFLITACATGAQAKPKVSSSLPAHKLLFDSNRTGNFEIYRLDGNVATQLTNDKKYDSWWAKASPDGTKMLFYRVPKGVHDRDYGKTSLWMANIDGSDAHEIISNKANGWNIQGHAEWSPNGQLLVMFGGPFIWITDTQGNIIKKVSNGIDPSWTSNGKGIVFISCENYPKCRPKDFRVYFVAADGTHRQELVHEKGRANDPYMSPDGRYISWITTLPLRLRWDLMIADINGGKARPLVADGNINSKPDFAADGTIYFHKTMPDVHKGFGLWSIQPDGSSLTWVSEGQPGVNEYPNVIPSMQ